MLTGNEDVEAALSSSTIPSKTLLLNQLLESTHIPLSTTDL